MKTRCLKTLNGSTIARSKFGVGKQMGSQVYLHKNYALDVVPPDVWFKALEALGGIQFNTIMYDLSKPLLVRFDATPDFDTAREPCPGIQTLVDISTMQVIRCRTEHQIFHHKFLWVKDDYIGFDIEESYKWSETWLRVITNPSGYKDKWEQLLLNKGVREYD